jgi:NAD(P)-dependent dehydrogenase (short-subunit alcohol dehydrogenase family)
VRRIRGTPVETLSAEEFHSFWRVNCLGAFHCAQRIIPLMKAQQRGTILFTGATGSTRSLGGYSSFSVGKFGLRALAQSLYRELHADNIHVAHIIVDGPVDTPIIGGYIRKQMAKSDEKGDSDSAQNTAAVPAGVLLNPDDIADLYFFLHSQPRSAWTFELDVRPQREPMAKL